MNRKYTPAFGGGPLVALFVIAIFAWPFVLWLILSKT